MITIPGYSIVRPLGRGGMAEVYLAIQQSVEREVALKILAPDLAGDPAFSERFISEARIASRLVHPNIVTIYDVGIEGPYHYLSMEYIPGRDLKQARYSLALSKRLAVVKDVAQALNFAGRKGYVHRDVKPDNIMLHADDGRAVLMDFGIARPSGAVGGMTQTGTTMGTPHYMSPEQARGWEVDSRSDLYSLGIVLYLLLTGRVPFDADSPVAVGVQHVSEPIPLLVPELSVFQPILNQILAKDPEQRYQNGEQLIAALDALPADELERLEHNLFQAAPPCEQKSPGDACSLGYCSDSDPTVAVTLPTVTRMPQYTHPAVVYTGKERRSNPYFLPPETGWPTPPPPRPEAGFRHWPWWLGIVFAAIAGYGMYVQQQLLADSQSTAAELSEAVARAGTALAESAVAENGSTEKTAATDGPVTLTLVTESLPATTGPAAHGDPDLPAQPAAEQTEQVAATAAALPTAGESLTADQVLQQLPLARQIEVLTTKAQRLHLQGDILTPPDANELDTWRDILDLDSNHEAARRAVETIEQGLVTEIEFHMTQERWHDARAAIAQAMVYFPASKRLHMLKLRNEEAVVAASQPKIEQMRVSHRMLLGVDQPQDVFLPAEQVLYVGFVFANFPPGAAVVEALLLRSESEVVLAKLTVPITRSEGEEYLRFEQNSFADGRYRVDLIMNEKLLASSEFEISHPPQL